ncbi:MAG: 23S rRNA (guanosine(2251)-2'-O)-methyltransferase RlmB [Spirochaetales bacterium]|nr:23S rRNA (guanosine(2251)-2'-O)-methyltransferase RlmB [Spirochaetales bacterium]
MDRIIFGYHSIEERLEKGAGKACLLYSREKGRCGHIMALAERKGIRVQKVSEDELDRRCERQKHRGLLLIIEGIPEERVEKGSFVAEIDSPHPVVLLLDGITDPHNYGAILRCADQFGVDSVIAPKRKSAHETGVVHVTSAGASAYVRQVVVANLVHAIDLLKKDGFWIYGADAEGVPVYNVDLTGKIGIILGSEGKGMRRLVREACDAIIGIPQRGHINSLNVSVAAGILLYECRRQQGLEKK